MQTIGSNRVSSAENLTVAETSFSPRAVRKVSKMEFKKLQEKSKIMLNGKKKYAHFLICIHPKV